MIKKDNTHVLYIDHVGFIGGAEISLINMVKLLQSCHQVHPLVILPESGLLKDTFDEIGFETIIVPMVPLDLTRNPFTLIRYLYNLFHFINQVRQIIKENNIDLIHANSIKSGILVGLAAWLTRKPLVWHIRDFYSQGRIRTLIRIWAKMFATHIIVISNRVATMFDQILNISVVYNGVDLAAFEPELLNNGHVALRNELALEKDVLVVGTIGQLSKWKRQHLFLLAAEKILFEYPHVHFVIVGDNYERQDDAYKNELYNLAQERLPDSAFTFLGWREDIVAVFGMMDMMVHLAKEEPFGRVVVEAMAAEIPVIGANSGGLPEIIKNGETGFLVEDDVHIVVDTAVRLLENETLRKKMGKAASLRAETHFSVYSNAQKVFQIYQQIAAREIR